MIERLQPGDRAPDFSLEADDLTTVSLDALKGRRFVLYFYPHDDTPGCTKQACSLRDEFASLRALMVDTFGVSPDSVERHRAFREKHALPFRLLADVDHVAAEAFGVWVSKRNAVSGLDLMGNERTTFVVGPDARIESVIANVDPELHAAQLLDALRTNAAGPAQQ